MSSVPDSFDGKGKRRSKSAINGYIRDIEENLFVNHPFYDYIPDIVNALCFDYFYISKDRFDPVLHAESIVIKENVILNTATDVNVASAFLSNIVSEGSHEWRFKIIRSSKNWGSFFIGIWNNKIDATQYLDKYNYPAGGNDVNQDQRAYGLNTVVGYLRGDPKKYYTKYCPKCNDGDFVEMCLDLDKFELRYNVNDKQYKKAFDVPKSTWRACVCFNHKDDELELVHYKQI